MNLAMGQAVITPMTPLVDGFDTTITVDNQSFTTSHYFDTTLGRPKGMRYPNGLTLEYLYNDTGYLKWIKNAANRYIYHEVTAQDAFGNNTQGKLGNMISYNKRFATEKWPSGGNSIFVESHRFKSELQRI